MPNQFLGFPVPKAKIAEMIEGYAPPISHHERHESGGDDEIDCTNLVGTGGFNFSSFAIQETPEALAGYENTEPGPGVVTVESGYLVVKTNGDASATTFAKKELNYGAGLLSWSKAREATYVVRLIAATGSAGDLFIGVGNPDATNHICFRVEDGVLKAQWRGSGSVSQQTIEDFGSSGYGESKTLRWVFTPGVSIKFYVDGSLVHTASTNLPSGAGSTNAPFIAMAIDSGVAQNREIRVQFWSFYQAL